MPGDSLGKVRRFAREKHLFEGAERVLVGFSGGADSTALLVILRELLENVVAVHLHHGLRDDSAAEDAAWCERFCALRGMAFVRHDLAVDRARRPRESTEMTARRCRLELWREIAGEGDVVALGHHADDCLENLILRLARGANSSGLVAPRPAAVIAGVRFVRPLLPLRRREIENFLTERGILDWRTDPTNLVPAHRRNAVRLRVLPLLRETFGEDQGLFRAIEALREEADFLEQAAARACGKINSLADWRALHPALLGRVLRMWLTARTGADPPLPGAAVRRLRAELERPCRGTVRLPISNDLLLELRREGMRLVRPARRIEERTWRWQERPRLDLPEVGVSLRAEPMGTDGLGRDPRREVFARPALPPVLTVRSWCPGDRMIPFGAATPKKVQDIFTADRVPREQRGAVPVVQAGDRVVWLAGVRRAEFGRIEAESAPDAVTLRLDPCPAVPRTGNGKTL